MGWFGNIAGKVRSWIARDDTHVARAAARGATNERFPVQQRDLLLGLNYQGMLSDWITVDRDLISRFRDYEEMDDYPEIACLSRDSRVGILGDGEHGIQYVTIDALLARRREKPDEKLHTLAVDVPNRRVVPVEFRGPFLSGTNQPIFKVVFEQYRANPGQPKKRWSVRATANHPFMLRDGSYCTVANLQPGQRLMPCSARTAPNGYPQLRDPFRVGNKGAPIWYNLHSLIAATLLRVPEAHEVVHHADENKQNCALSNLKIEPRAEHSSIHAVTQRPEIRKKLAQVAKSRWADPDQARAWAAAQRRRGAASVLENPNPEPKGVLSDAHRAAIAAGRTIPLARDVVENALCTSRSMSEACRKLGVSWNTLERRRVKYGFPSEIVGSRLQSVHEGQSGYENHVVVSVEPDGFGDVFDIEVPGLKNFVAEGVFVHNTAIDIFADDATQTDSVTNRTMWITSSDKRIQEILDDELLQKRLVIDEEIWEIARTLVKYGNDYEEILLGPDGVVGFNFLPPATVRRVEDAKGNLLGFLQDFKERFQLSPQDFLNLLKKQMKGGGPSEDPNDPNYAMAALEDWEVVHFRLRSKYRRSVYGYSVLEPARWIWKRLTILEDAAILFRLTKAVERFAFYIDVGDMPPAEALAYVNRVRQQYRKKKYVNPTTGKLELRFDALAQDEDFFVPSRGGQEGTRIDVVGAPQWQHMDDIEYFRDKMFSAIKVPKAYLSQEQGVARAVLSSEDVRFARSVLRVQRELKNGIRRVCKIHLMAKNIDPTSVDFEVWMTVPSAIFELAQLEVRNARADLAARMNDFVSLHWILKNVFGLPEEDIEVIIRERGEDTVRATVAQGKGEAEAQKLISAAAPGQGPGDIGAGESLDLRMAAMMERVRERAKARGYGSVGISREELKERDPLAEKRASAKLDAILRTDKEMAARLKDTSKLLKELAGAIRQRQH